MSNSVLHRTLLFFVVVTPFCVPSARAIAFDDEPEAFAGAEDEPRINVNEIDITVFDYEDALEFTFEASSQLGVDVAPISAALRTQLGLREDRGVVVTNVEPDGPGDQAGIRLHDVLLSVAGEPVNDPAVLQEQIDSSDDEPLSMILMRGGKRMSLDVTRPNRIPAVLTLETSQSYWIGIVADEADDALRVQLGLPAGTGLVVTEVYDDMAADEAGIETHDILLEFDGVKLESVEELNARIQEVGDGMATVLVVRGGDELNLRVTPRTREVGQELLWYFDRSASLYDLDALTFTGANGRYIDLGDGRFVDTETGDVASETGTSDPESSALEDKLHGLIQEMRTLTERMRSLQQSFGGAESGGAFEGDLEELPEAE